MTAQAFGAGRHQILAERMSSSPTINDNKCSTRRAHLDTRCVSSVTSRARSRFGDRTARDENKPPRRVPGLDHWWVARRALRGQSAAPDRLGVDIFERSAHDL